MPNPVYTNIFDKVEGSNFKMSQSSFVCTQFNGFKYCYIILIVLFNINHFVGKYAILTKKVEQIELPNHKSIRTLGLKENYNYLGRLEADTIKWGWKRK